MTLLALLLVGTVGAAGTAWALPRGGMAAQVGALVGVIGLALIAILAAASPTPASIAVDATGAVPGTLWNGALAPNGYLRLVVVLAAVTSIVMCAIAWLLRGVSGLRGLLPASLAALVGTAAALGATTPQLGLVAAGATGLASVPVLLATPRAVAAGVAAREVRVAVATALAVLAVASVLPTLSRLVSASAAGDGVSAGSGIAAAVAFGLLAIALVVAARVGAFPYHVRVSALTDSADAGSLPLVLAWLPLPLAAASVGVVLGELAPLGLPVGSAQALIVFLALLATIAGGLAASLQDDLRHAVGYLTLADLGLVVLAFAALDPAAWGPARTWLLTAAVTKSALAAWAVVAEDRFETRSVPELRGWLRPSPLLGLSLVLILIATYGLPGWAVLTARIDLTRLAAGGPWNLLLLGASLLTMPAYARWLWLGIGVATSHVDGATPEFLALRAASGRTGSRLRPPVPRRRRDEGLPVEQETDASYGIGSVGHPGAGLSVVHPPLTAAPPATPAAPTPSAQPSSARRAVAPAPVRPSSRRPDETKLWGEPEPPAERKPVAERPPAGGPAPRLRPTRGRAEPSVERPVEAAPPVRPKPAPAPAPAVAPTLFDLPDPDATSADAGAPTPPELGSIRAGTGVGRRTRTPNDRSGSSPMTAPRPPEASKALPVALLAADGDPVGAPSSPGPVTRALRGRAPSGPDAATRAASAVRRHRADLLSAAVLALALLATVVAAGAFDVSKAACEPTQAVPSISAVCQ